MKVSQEKFESIKENCTNKAEFIIDKIPFKVYSSNLIDIKWLKFIFRHYSSVKNLDDVISFYLMSDMNNGFMKNYLNNSCTEKFIIEKDKEAWIWGSEHTPIPPFLVGENSKKYLLMHGCVAISPSGESYMFLGSSMSGKTYTLLRFIEKGYKLVTDDLIIFSLERKCIIPYYKPIGLRETTLGMNSKLVDAVEDDKIDKLVFTANNLKKTWLVHVEDIFPNSLCDSKVIEKVSKVIVLNDEASDTVRQLNLGEALQYLGTNIMNFGESKIGAVSYLINYFSNTDFYLSPKFNGDNLIKQFSRNY